MTTTTSTSPPRTFHAKGVRECRPRADDPTPGRSRNIRSAAAPPLHRRSASAEPPQPSLFRRARTRLHCKPVRRAPRGAGAASECIHHKPRDAARRPPPSHHAACQTQLLCTYCRPSRRHPGCPQALNKYILASCSNNVLRGVVLFVTKNFSSRSARCSRIFGTSRYDKSMHFITL